MFEFLMKIENLFFQNFLTSLVQYKAKKKEAKEPVKLSSEKLKTQNYKNSKTTKNYG